MAIKRPQDLDFSNKKFMVIISGAPGIGKTTLALSAPNPILIDTDRGIARVRAEHRRVSSEPESYEELLEDIQSDAYKAADSVVIDTGGTLVQLMKGWAKKQDAKAAKDGRAMYGVIKTEFDRLCYQIRNVDKKHLIVVFHTTEQNKGDTVQTRLSCEGSTKDIVWTPADFGGHMFMMGNKRMIGFSPTDEYFAKGCFGIQGIMQVPDLKPGQPNDFLTRLFTQTQQVIAEEARSYAEDREAYDEVMAEVGAYIEQVTDPDSAQAATEALNSAHHVLTSKAELAARLKDKLAEQRLAWDKAGKCYVVLDDSKPAQ